MKTAKQILTEAAKLVEQGWTQYTFARDKQGRKCLEKSDDAVYWCAIGAMMRASEADALVHDYEREEAKAALLVTIGEEWGEMPVTTWNDQCATSGNEVATVMRKAAERLA